MNACKMKQSKQLDKILKLGCHLYPTFYLYAYKFLTNRIVAGGANAVDKHGIPANAIIIPKIPAKL